MVSVCRESADRGRILISQSALPQFFHPNPWASLYTSWWPQSHRTCIRIEPTCSHLAKPVLTQKQPSWSRSQSRRSRGAITTVAYGSKRTAVRHKQAQPTSSLGPLFSLDLGLGLGQGGNPALPLPLALLGKTPS